MPSFCAIRPVRPVLEAMVGCSFGPPSDLDLDVHAGREVELHQRVHRLRRGVDDVEEPAVRPDLELLAALLVDVRRAVDREPLDLRRQRYGAADARARPLGRAHDLPRAAVEHAVIERLQAYADVLAFHRPGARPSSCYFVI